jgi:iron complex transport system substrate-binding protein
VADYPARIVCLTEETTETLYLLGEGDRVVGVSAYTVRPPEARRKPRVSAFLSANLDRIDALRPDLVLAFSDLQADIARELIRRGHAVYTFNQRSVAEILQMVRIVGALVGCADKAHALAADIQRGLDEIAPRLAPRAQRPRVFFEEWPDPLISGIRWVEELVEIAGGEPIFPELRDRPLAKGRIVDAAEVAARNPDVIVASWCGKRVRKATITARAGWDGVTAVRSGQVHEIPSSIILQPGPASLTDGVRELRRILDAAASAPRRAPLY